jgi:hypothetical protein
MVTSAGQGVPNDKPVFHGALDRFAHARMVVADDHRPPRADIVDIARAFDVPQIGAIRARGEERLAADRLECAHRRIHAAGHQRLCALEEFVIARHGGGSADG